MRYRSAMAFKFGKRSETNLRGVHADLVRVLRSAIATSPIDFAVLEGVRSRRRQAELVKAGASRTMNSRHIDGCAVDIAPFVDGEVRWDWPLFRILAKHIKATAKAEKVTIQWGGDWRTFKDGPHFELPRRDRA